MARARPEGSALILALVMGLIITALAFFSVVAATGVLKGAGESRDSRQAQYTAEAGANVSLRELIEGADPDGDGIGVIPSTPYSGDGHYEVTTSVQGGLTVLRSIGRLGVHRRGVEVSLADTTSTDVTYTARAAVVSNGPIDTKGNITIDGRDWAADNSAVVGAGVYGVSSRDQVSAGGNSKIGGVGIAPITKPNDPDGVYEENAPWADGLDNDGDASSDEEYYDGYDDDGDGLIDEDTGDFPDNPDALLGLAPGMLMASAQAQGTYFATQADFDAYRTASGGSLPGGKIFYLDFSQCVPTDLGASMNAEPSVLISHNAAGTANLKNIHGQFKGLILTDTITHINSNTILLGAVFSFAPYAAGNSYGNGNATVRYSGAVLGSLPWTSTSGSGYTVTAWRTFTPGP